MSSHKNQKLQNPRLRWYTILCRMALYVYGRIYLIYFSFLISSMISPVHSAICSSGKPIFLNFKAVSMAFLNPDHVQYYILLNLNTSAKIKLNI
ncbi:hypothetical protein C8N37_106482 [Sphingobacterium faecium]|nr:hypothetical protein C8N37_106482 [Sphingobacterium faecium]